MCKLDSDYVIECIGTNRLVFGRMSEVGSKWMKKVAKMPSNQRLDDAKHKKFTREVYNQIWDSYNYSLR